MGGRTVQAEQRAAHRQVGRLQDVDACRFPRRRPTRPTRPAAPPRILIASSSRSSGSITLESRDAADAPPRVEDHRRRDDRARQRPAARLVDAGTQARLAARSKLTCAAVIDFAASFVAATRGSLPPPARSRRAAASRGWLRKCARARPRSARSNCASTAGPSTSARTSSLKYSGTTCRPASRFGCAKNGALKSFKVLSRKACQRAEAVGDHHRPLDERRFERRGARRRRSTTSRRRQRLAAPAVDQRHALAHAGRIQRRAQTSRARARWPAARRTSAPGAALQPGDGRRESAAQPRDLALRLPGSSATRRARGRARARRAPAERIEIERNLIRQRMTDEHRAHAVLVVEPLLERQQAQHEVDGPADGLARAPAARPRPAGSRTARCGSPAPSAAARAAG